MSEDGCLRDGYFNRIQVERGGLQEAFTEGVGSFNGLTINEENSIDMGGNKVTNTGDPTDDKDSANKYYVDSIFPARFLTWIGDGPPQKYRRKYQSAIYKPYL